nr:unnamed protein product [Macaca fascicularis]
MGLVLWKHPWLGGVGYRSERKGWSANSLGWQHWRVIRSECRAGVGRLFP